MNDFLSVGERNGLDHSIVTSTFNFKNLGHTAYLFAGFLSLAGCLTYRIGYDAILPFQVLIHFQMTMYIFQIGIGYDISEISVVLQKALLYRKHAFCSSNCL